MKPLLTSLFSFDGLSEADVLALFQRTHDIKAGVKSYSGAGRVACLAFLEESTRTSCSFQMACHRLNVSVVNFNQTQSSMCKGESPLETIKTLAALQPDLMVVRWGDDEDVWHFLTTQNIPVIVAGYGKLEHPTQSLLDMYTVYESLPPHGFKGLRVLFVGDCLHSRVFSSHCSLLKILGAQVGICGPKVFWPEDLTSFKIFEDIDQALVWADICEPLRVQWERHADICEPLRAQWEREREPAGISAKEYSQRFCISAEALRRHTNVKMLLHPGPHNPGVDIEPEVLDDSRCKVREQVTNGVLLRMALLVECLRLRAEL